MRAELGPLVIGATGIAVSWVPISQDNPWWATALVLVATLIGVILSWPVKRSAVAKQPTAFIRGDASGSSLTDVRSDADIFIDGDAREALLLRIIHKRRRR